MHCPVAPWTQAQISVLFVFCEISKHSIPKLDVPCVISFKTNSFHLFSAVFLIFTLMLSGHPIIVDIITSTRLLGLFFCFWTLGVRRTSSSIR